MPDTDVCAAWGAGCHMVALNFQTWDGAMQLNRALFAMNSNLGYVLQPPPPVLPSSTDSAWPPVGLAPPEKLRVVILSANHLPKRDGDRCQREAWDEVEVPQLGLRFETETMTSGDVITPIVEVDVIGGVMTVCSSKLSKARRKQWGMALDRISKESGIDPNVESNGLNPRWEHPLDLSCLVWHPQHAFLRFSVYKRVTLSRVTGGHRRWNSHRQLIAYEMIPLSCLRQGYRSVPLRSPSGKPICNCALFVFISKRRLPFEIETRSAASSSECSASPREVGGDSEGSASQLTSMAAGETAGLSAAVDVGSTCSRKLQRLGQKVAQRQHFGSKHSPARHACHAALLALHVGPDMAQAASAH